MGDISPSCSPTNNRPITILQMRPPTTLLGDRRHLNQPDRGNLTFPASNQLIQPILGVTPQLHDLNVQPACDKNPPPPFRPPPYGGGNEASVVHPGQESLATGHN